MKKIHSIQYLRAIAAILVVLAHNNPQGIQVHLGFRCSLLSPLLLPMPFTFDAEDNPFSLNHPLPQIHQWPESFHHAWQIQKGSEIRMSDPSGFVGVFDPAFNSVVSGQAGLWHNTVTL